MPIKFRYLWILAILLAGCAREFPETKWSPRESARRDELQQQSDFASRLELARMEFMHNRINEADGLLSQLVRERPNNMEAKAWHAANRCRLAERHGPWLLGLDKAYLLWDCLAELERAAHHAPDDLSVSLAQIITDTEVAAVGSVHRAFKVRDRVLQQIETKPEGYAASAKAAFYEAVALLETRHGNPGSARHYLNRVIALNTDPDSVERARQSLALVGVDVTP